MKSVLILACKYFKKHSSETVLVFYLDATNNIIGFEPILGSYHSFYHHITPKLIFRNAIIANADNVILIKNSFDNDITPKKEDINLTRKLMDCGKILDIKFNDYILANNINDWCSTLNYIGENI